MRWLPMCGAIFAGVAALLVVNTLPAPVTLIASGHMRSPIPAVYIASLCAFNFAWLAFGTVQFAVMVQADRVVTAASRSPWRRSFRSSAGAASRCGRTWGSRRAEKGPSKVSGLALIP